MSTLLQKELAQQIVINATQKPRRRKNKKELLVSAGYALETAEATPGRTIDQIGVQKELNLLGFTVDNAKRVIREILDSNKAKDRDKINAAKEVFAVQGEYAPEKHLVVEKRLISFDE